MFLGLRYLLFYYYEKKIILPRNFIEKKKSFLRITVPGSASRVVEEECQQDPRAGSRVIGYSSTNTKWKEQIGSGQVYAVSKSRAADILPSASLLYSTSSPNSSWGPTVQLSEGVRDISH